MLFKDAPFLERFERAAAAGFPAVEFWWPAGEALAEVEAAIRDAGLAVALFNFDAGDMAAGDRGLPSDADRAPRFRENVPVALELAERIGCERLNALVGLERSPAQREAQLKLAADNVAWAADRARRPGAPPPPAGGAAKARPRQRRGAPRPPPPARHRHHDRARQPLRERAVPRADDPPVRRVHRPRRAPERPSPVRRLPHAA